VERIHLDAELPDGLAVDGDPTVEDDLFTRSPGSNAGIGQKFLEANHGDLRLSIADLRFAV
jgi:hypothetical protein